MTDPDISITYEGGDADQHSIDMRLLGVSLQGADRIISDGLVVFIHGRMPKRRERAPVIAKVREPIEGSYAFIAAWDTVKALLPLGIPSSADLAGYFISQWWTAVIAKFSGKPEIAEKAIEAMLAMNRDHLAAREADAARQHELNMQYAAALREAINAQGRSVEQFAAPVGPSVNEVVVIPHAAAPARLTLDDAEAIRENQKLEWKPVQEEVLRTDGFKFHTNGLSVENPERDGFLMARVHDPKFDEEENVYTEAAQRRSAIAVLARKGYKGDELAAIEILEFVREIAA